MARAASGRALEFSVPCVDDSGDLTGRHADALGNLQFDEVAADLVGDADIGSPRRGPKWSARSSAKTGWRPLAGDAGWRRLWT